LPWEWFDFLEAARPPGQGLVVTVDEGGAARVWRVTIDGRIVPFRLLRRRPLGSPRPLLVMLHGMGLTAATFRGVAGYLFETHDLALIDYSTLTTGLSAGSAMAADGWPHDGVALRVMAQAVWAVADAAGVEQFDLAGNSLGGALCLVAALQHPERIRRMVLANPACYPQRLPLMYRLARIPLAGEILMATRRAEALIGGIERIGYVDKSRFDPELRQRYLRCMGARRNRFRLMEMIRHLPHGARDMTVAAHVPRLKEIRQRVLLSWGEQDPLLTPGAGPRLAGDLPNCIYRPYPDLAHMPHEEAPERVGPEWAEFLKREE
jgi:pimeloyl-ACP methyl ester carboxylesterase